MSRWSVSATRWGSERHREHTPSWVSSSHTGQWSVVKYWEMVPFLPTSSPTVAEEQDALWISEHVHPDQLEHAGQRRQDLLADVVRGVEAEAGVLQDLHGPTHQLDEGHAGHPVHDHGRDAGSGPVGAAAPVLLGEGQVLHAGPAIEDLHALMLHELLHLADVPGLKQELDGTLQDLEDTHESHQNKHAARHTGDTSRVLNVRLRCAAAITSVTPLSQSLESLISRGPTVESADGLPGFVDDAVSNLEEDG
ncbi:hypothetical protein EYF80_004454 [Liparis tanakae]|uniref:Uncharacterized protein n=1 Tax=Liparis tanakae TaxID=230148 RepID=A0A4Z2J7L6_9TELE|nr:hypothetical protein EYF80_004454 [Liparis tanakae]